MAPVAPVISSETLAPVPVPDFDPELEFDPELDTSPPLLLLVFELEPDPEWEPDPELEPELELDPEPVELCPEPEFEEPEFVVVLGGEGTDEPASGPGIIRASALFGKSITVFEVSSTPAPSIKVTFFLSNERHILSKIKDSTMMITFILERRNKIITRF
ncbi:hypothetical protein [Sporolactobacillus inulinus]|uniref:hypothetical protein n=1 Tax=Sporolactobacillus inulinus TaxID=2078 RepID=UPI0021CC9662|nr:hypothetical protein [Sporolactobacillus inulinus]